jgi:hypothetical protein
MIMHPRQTDQTNPIDRRIMVPTVGKPHTASVDDIKSHAEGASKGSKNGRREPDTWGVYARQVLIALDGEDWVLGDRQGAGGD